jgi:hypothetical protein
MDAPGSPVQFTEETRHENSLPKRYFALEIILAMAVLAISNIPVVRPTGPVVGNSGTHGVTLEPHHGTNIPAINREDVIVYQGNDRY